MKTGNYIALTLVIIGALNWGLIGFFGFDLVTTIFGGSMFWLACDLRAGRSGRALVSAALQRSGAGTGNGTDDPWTALRTQAVFSTAIT